MIGTAEDIRAWQMKGWKKDLFESLKSPIQEVWVNVGLCAKAYVRKNNQGLAELKIVPLH